MRTSAAKMIYITSVRRDINTDASISISHKVKLHADFASTAFINRFIKFHLVGCDENVCTYRYIFLTISAKFTPQCIFVEH